MNPIIMYGKPVAEKIRQTIKEKIATKNYTLAILLIGDDPASQVYLQRLEKTAQLVGAAIKKIILPATTTQQEAEALLENLNKDDTIQGIMPLMPFPQHLNAKQFCDKLAPEKDVDCLSPRNAGEVFLGTNKWAPCTPRSCLAILQFYGITLAGKQVVVLGRSNVVGKPVALLLLEQNATVTVCHSKTKNLPAILAGADVIVAALGKAEFVKGNMVKDGVVIVDVGINLIDHKLVGDVAPDAYAKSSAYTPVPGGVGVVSNSMVLEALVK